MRPSPCSRGRLRSESGPTQPWQTTLHAQTCSCSCARGLCAKIFAPNVASEPIVLMPFITESETCCYTGILPTSSKLAANRSWRNTCNSVSALLQEAGWRSKCVSVLACRRPARLAEAVLPGRARGQSAGISGEPSAADKEAQRVRNFVYKCSGMRFVSPRRSDLGRQVDI
jgi:hypothetical protein